jgi:hypothetical protein
MDLEKCRSPDQITNFQEIKQAAEYRHAKRSKAQQVSRMIPWCGCWTVHCSIRPEIGGQLVAPQVTKKLLLNVFVLVKDWEPGTEIINRLTGLWVGEGRSSLKYIAPAESIRFGASRRSVKVALYTRVRLPDQSKSLWFPFTGCFRCGTLPLSDPI